MHASHQHIGAGQELAHLVALCHAVKRLQSRTHRLKVGCVLDLLCQANHLKGTRLRIKDLGTIGDQVKHIRSCFFAGLNDDDSYAVRLQGLDGLLDLLL